MQPRLQNQLKDLQRLKSAQESQLEITLARSSRDEKSKETHRIKRKCDIKKVFESYQHWVEDSMQTAPNPYIQLIAVLARVES